ncbi:PHF10 [Bugula neritina]|uniref:PHF10 n=1 Tax=Bugula neritina TaxID=10212 RepID=A0A7J7KLI2_BUGNE|nr:PHF10 [Bugula neritina]
MCDSEPRRDEQLSSPSTVANKCSIIENPDVTEASLPSSDPQSPQLDTHGSGLEAAPAEPVMASTSTPPASVPCVNPSTEVSHIEPTIPNTLDESIQKVDDSIAEINKNEASEGLQENVAEVASPSEVERSVPVDTESAMVSNDSQIPPESMDTSVDLAAAGEDSCQSGAGSESASPQKKTRVTNSRLIVSGLPQGVGADTLFEYRWPLDDEHSDYWMLQEQVSTFLNVKSFRRKHPDLERRQIEMEERNYLLSVGVVTEMQCDLGLTALRSEDISDLMIQEYSDKYDEYAKVLRKREEERLAKKHQDLQDLQNSVPSQPVVSKVDMKKLTEKAVKAAASYNAFLMKEKREERRHYFDIQTGIIQSPKSLSGVLPPELTRPSPYPVAVLRGQFAQYYKRYTPDELNYLPLKTVLYDPPIRIHNPYMPLPPEEEAAPTPLPQVDNSLLPTTVELLAADPLPPKKQMTRLVDAICILCGREENRSGAAEKCIKCNQCRRETHPSCSELTPEMLARVVTYSWTCMECKVCVRCSDPGNEDKMIVCDKCDRGYHTFCVGLKAIPEESIWACPECAGSS